MLLVLFLFSLLSLSLGNADWEDPERLAEEDGYYRREHSLTQPYQGRGMDVSFKNDEVLTVCLSVSLFLCLSLDTFLGIWRFNCCNKGIRSSYS